MVCVCVFFFGGGVVERPNPHVLWQRKSLGSERVNKNTYFISIFIIVLS